MASRNRDLTFSLLSDANAFDLAAPARELEDLSDTAKDTARGLDDLERDARRVDLEGTLGRDAKAAAGKVDDAFDTIARASRKSARKVDDDTDDMKRSVGDVGDEAKSTATEMAASFSGAGDDVVGAFQELGANAGAAFGPIGVAAGVAASVGLGLIRAESEKLKEMTSELVQDMIDAGGKLNDAAIDARVQQMATDDPANFIKFNEQAKAAGINIRDVARARAGDVAAIERVRDAIEKQIIKQREASEGSYVAQRGPIGGLQDLRQELNLTTKATVLAQEAVATATSATTESVLQSTSTAGGAWDDLSGRMRDPITGKIRIRRPSNSEYRKVRQDLNDGIGPIIVDVIANPRTDLFYPGRSRP